MAGRCLRKTQKGFGLQYIPRLQVIREKLDGAAMEDLADHRATTGFNQCEWSRGHTYQRRQHNTLDRPRRPTQQCYLVMRCMQFEQASLKISASAFPLSLSKP